MTSFDRDAMIERRQIHEISLNVARRLRHVLDRNRYIPAAMTGEVEQTVRVITGIQRDIDQIMDALPATEALDFAILTHIMGGQRHALDLLEILEEKLEGGQSAYRRDSARVHQALLAVSREIEQDALRYGVEPPVSQTAPSGFAAPERSRGGPARPTNGPRGQRPAPTQGKQRGKQPSPKAGSASGGRLLALILRPVTIALTALAIGAGIVIAAQQWMRPAGDAPEIKVAAPSTPEQAPKSDGGSAEAAASADASPAPSSHVETAAVAAPAVDQPYLVVLATRRSTEELQQDYRGFKGSYPDLLGNARARVDRVQGQDKQTWYRLSLIPPQSRDEAKTLCSNLRKAGLAGCWIKSVPLH